MLWCLPAVQRSSEVKGEGLTAGGSRKIQRNVHTQMCPMVANVNPRARDGTHDLLPLPASATGDRRCLHFGRVTRDRFSRTI